MVENIILPFITTEKGRRLGWVLLAIASIIFSFTVIKTLTIWRQDFLLTHPPLIAVNDDTTVDTADMQLVTQLPKQHVFGQSAEDTGFLPITSLQIRLTGITKSAHDDLSRAMISEAGQHSKVYAIGDILVPGIRIYAINADDVILEHRGRLEKLPLIRSPLSFKNSPQSLWP